MIRYPVSGEPGFSPSSSSPSSFSLPRLIPLKINHRRLKSIADGRFRRYRPVAGDHRSGGGPVCTAQYGVVPLGKANLDYRVNTNLMSLKYPTSRTSSNSTRLFLMPKKYFSAFI
ncbi:hypothetical protein GW17_00034792 [Ensete ventricosum]|nr:hypothetical protein GW17_00034792 [Ensete ventricosum]RZR79880.1 hypothetical protein BHM03_00005724 [Ensete ventricosum]